jgi:lysozyme
MSNVRNSALVAVVIALATPIAMHFEGLRTVPYRDPVGILTDCYGRTGTEVVAGRVLTVAQCKQFLRQDLKEAYADVDRCINQPLQPNQAAAFTSLAFNIGGPKFCASSLVKKANAGNVIGACAELSRWVFADGKPLPGLVARRAKERSMCEQKTG